MEGAVFSYFLAIGAGLTFGASIVALPALWLASKLIKKGDKEHVRIRK